MRRIAIALALAAASAANPAAAQDGWPNRQIRVIVPLPAGAAVDVVGRLLFAKLGERLGQTFVIENRPGASGAIASDLVAKAAPDGYTLGMATTTTHVSTLLLNAKLPYHPVKDFVPLAMVGIAPYILTVYPKLPVNNLKELLDLAKAKPKMLNYSSIGNASLGHLATELLAQRAGVQMNHVPYRATVQAVLDLAEGRIEVTFGLLGSNLPLIRDRKIRPIALSSLQRMPHVPDTPTIAESGMPGFEASLWFAVVGPAKLPAPIVSRLNKEINELLDDPDIRKLLYQQAVSVEKSTPDQLRARIAADIEKWRKVADQLGIKPQ